MSVTEYNGVKTMNFLREVSGWISSIFIAVIIALAINIFIFQPTVVEGSSMEPTLSERDKVLVNKLPHTFGRMPDYGDIVVIDSRVDRPHTIGEDLTDSLKYNMLTCMLSGKRYEIYWIKRVIGRPGDTLEFKDGKVLRNGKELSEPYIKEAMRYSSNAKITVPPDCVFVMGDNRNYSKDSRVIGPIPLDHVVGKYILKF